MANRLFYVLCNVTGGIESEHETLDAALDAVDRTVDENDQWDIHEFLSGSVARWIIGGYGPTTWASRASAAVG